MYSCHSKVAQKSCKVIRHTVILLPTLYYGTKNFQSDQAHCITLAYYVLRHKNLQSDQAHCIALAYSVLWQKKFAKWSGTLYYSCLLCITAQKFAKWSGTLYCSCLLCIMAKKNLQSDQAHCMTLAYYLIMAQKICTVIRYTVLLLLTM
jgi:hypothetical protein